MLIQAETVA